ncbi:Uncharacterised protein [uncultured archaeon]|nr:Uncharacterised protein [uncultured archaeon]
MGAKAGMPFFEAPHCGWKILIWFSISVLFIGSIIYLANLFLPYQFRALIGPIALLSFAFVWILMQKFGHSVFRSSELKYSNSFIEEHKKDKINKELINKNLLNKCHTNATEKQ